MKKMLIAIALMVSMFMMVGCIEGDKTTINNTTVDVNTTSEDKPIVAQFTADCTGITADGGKIEAHAKVNYEESQSLSAFSFTVGQKTITAVEEYSNDGKQVDLYGTLRPTSNDTSKTKILTVKFLSLTSKGNTLLAKRECEQPPLLEEDIGESNEGNESN